MQYFHVIISTATITDGYISLGIVVSILTTGVRRDIKKVRTLRRSERNNVASPHSAEFTGSPVGPDYGNGKDKGPGIAS